MRVLIVSPYFAPSSAVGAARMTSLAGYLAGKGEIVDVVSLGRKYQLADAWNRVVPQRVNIYEVNGEDGIKELEKQTESLLMMNIYSILISSMGPFETIKFVFKQCQKENVPYILDYRDPWLFWPWYYDHISCFNRLKRFIKDCYYFPFEYISIRNASSVVTTTEKNADILKSRYRKYSDKIVTIFNGYDCLPRVKYENDSSSAEYTIVCTGKFRYYSESLAREFLRSLSRLRKDGRKVKLLHIGNDTDDASDIVKNENLDSDVYLYLGQYNYNRAMDLVAKQNAGLIIYSCHEGLSTKVFDYIGLNKPIMYYGVCPSELSRFISRFKNVVVASTPSDLEHGIKNFIDNRIVKLEEVKHEEYSRSFQNARYKDLIDKIVDKKFESYE